MKSKTIFLFVLILPSILLAQVFNSAILDIGNVRACFSSDGQLFYPSSNGPRFEVPKGSGDNASYAGHLWIGGLDFQGMLHVAAQTYRQSGSDFFQGPIMTSSNYSSTQDALWNRVWKINKTTIDSFRLGLFTNTPQIILDWPGNGNVALGQAAQLAPYKDVNNDNIYNPADGDFPCIKGDQAVYMIFNDDRNLHTETGGTKFGLEFHAMAFAFKDTLYPHLKNTVFLNYRIINRSANTYYNTYIGMWNDLEVGEWSDDYVGSNVERDYYYGYNGDNMDGSGGPGSYGINPPALGVAFLKGPVANSGDGMDNNKDCLIDENGESCLMSKFSYYNNDFTITGNPVVDTNYYTYLQGKWKNNTSITYGGTGYGGVLNASYMYPSSSDQLIGWGTGGDCQTTSIQPIWDEITQGNTPADRRGLGSSGEIDISLNEEICLDYAFIFAQGTNGNLSSVTLLETATDTIRHYYTSRNLDNCGCVVTPLGMNEDTKPVAMNLYPNPVTDLLQLVFASSNDVISVSVYDLSGKLVQEQKSSHSVSAIQINTSILRSGIYLLKAETTEGTVFRRFVKE